MLGLLGKKIGMTQIFKNDGSIVPATVIEAGPCFVVQIKKDAGAIQIGFGKRKKANKPLASHLKAANLKELPRYLREIKVLKVDEFVVGQEIKVDIFKAGDLVDITGTSRGLGFQGTVKRHHFNRGPMTHGSKFHRIPGSIGSGTRVGRVEKGTRMSGRMGGETVTVQNLEVLQVDPLKNLLLVKGAVPSFKGGPLMIRKA